jgi:uncharacterized membrane protein YuzA (DUF378 family)
MDVTHIIYLAVGLVGGYCIHLLCARYGAARKAGKSMREAISSSITGKDL